MPRLVLRWRHHNFDAPTAQIKLGPIRWRDRLVHHWSRHQGNIFGAEAGTRACTRSTRTINSSGTRRTGIGQITWFLLRLVPNHQPIVFTQAHPPAHIVRASLVQTKQAGHAHPFQ